MKQTNDFLSELQNVDEQEAVKLLGAYPAVPDKMKKRLYKNIEKRIKSKQLSTNSEITERFEVSEAPKKISFRSIFAAAACLLLVAGISGSGIWMLTKMRNPPPIEPKQEVKPTEIAGSMSQDDTTPDPQNNTESATDDAVEIGDGIYQISSIPHSEKVTLSCEYGTAYRSKGATAQAFGHTLDFSSIPNEYNNDGLPYCVCEDTSTVYFADYFKFYKSDLDMESPTLLFTMGYEQDELPNLIEELISFSNTDLLFFRGYTAEGKCIGSIDPETGETDFISCSNTIKTVPCNNGVMIYDYAAKQNSTVLYWECGEFYEIPLQNPAESEVRVYISANGKYICTYLWGKAQDNSLVERYSVYDVKSGAFLKSFDWTFQKKVSDRTLNGFTFGNINEETQSVYVHNTEDWKYYQFKFGG